MLASFAESHEITFDLLSDVDSRAIRELGLLNQDIDGQQAHFGAPTSEQYPDRYRGLPYPGVIMIDERGVVTAKHFDSGYRDRPSGSYLLHEMADLPFVMAVSDSRSDGLIRVTIGSESATFLPLQTHELFVQVEIANGFHVYTEPLPAGYIPLDVSVDSRTGIRVTPPERREGRLMEIEALGERLYVLEGVIEYRIPFKLGGSRYIASDSHLRAQPLPDTEFEIEVTVRYQACSDIECYPPREQRLKIALSESSRP